MADGESVETLVVEFDAKIDKVLTKLNSLNRSVHGSTAQIQKDFENIDVGRALDRVFDSSRLTLLDAGATRLRVFGSALEPLGIAGMGAAAGVTAAGLAIAQAIKAADYAETLDRAAKQIGLTTTALQEYDHAALAAAIPTETFRASLSGLNEKIGQVQSGVARKQLTRVFEALDLPADQLRRLGDLQSILPVIAQKLSELPAAEREGLAARLDIAPILPALLDGKKGLADIAAEAHRMGVVLDENLVQKGAESAKAMRLASAAISANLRSAFIEVAPAIAQATKLLAEFVGLMNRVDAWWFNRKAPPVQVSQADILDRLHMHSGAVSPLVTAAAGRGHGGRGGGGRDNTEEIAKASDDAVARAAEAEARAREALTANAEQRLVIALELLQTETAAKVADLAHQAAQKKITAAAARQATALTEQAAAEEARRLRQQADFKIEDAQIEVYRATVEAQIIELQNEAAMAATSGQRRRIEEHILALRQQLERDLEGTARDRRVATGELTPAQRDQLAAAQQAGQTSDMRRSAYDSTYQGVHAALEAAVRGGWPGLAHYMADKLQENLVDMLANGLTNALTGAGGGGGLFGWLLGGSLMGFATGTDSAPGGPAVVGERGPEIVNLRKGDTVLPNSALRAGVSAGMGRMTYAPTFDLRGAVVTQDLLEQMNAIAQQAEHRATMNGAALAVQASRNLIPGDISRRSGLRLA